MPCTFNTQITEIRMYNTFIFIFELLFCFLKHFIGFRQRNKI